jgi:hypothetical protein
LSLHWSASPLPIAAIVLCAASFLASNIEATPVDASSLNFGSLILIAFLRCEPKRSVTSANALI